MSFCFLVWPPTGIILGSLNGLASVCWSKFRQKMFHLIEVASVYFDKQNIITRIADMFTHIYFLFERYYIDLHYFSTLVWWRTNVMLCRFILKRTFVTIKPSTQNNNLLPLMVSISMITLQVIHKYGICDVNTSSRSGVLHTATDGVMCRTGGLTDLVSGGRSCGMDGRRSALRRRQSGL